MYCMYCVDWEKRENSFWWDGERHLYGHVFPHSANQPGRVGRLDAS
jgi:hypothetical protein